MLLIDLSNTYYVTIYSHSKDIFSDVLKIGDFLDRHLCRYLQVIVNEGFYFLILKNGSDFDDFFLNICFHLLFEIRNILVGAHKYFYCLNNNFAIYGKIQFFTIFIPKGIFCRRYFRKQL
jgi:hypothetical protein